MRAIDDKNVLTKFMSLGLEVSGLEIFGWSVNVDNALRVECHTGLSAPPLSTWLDGIEYLLDRA